MKISELVKRLNRIKKEYGDLDVLLLDHESGYHDKAGCLIKCHPINPKTRCGDYDKPIYGVEIAEEHAGEFGNPDRLFS